MSNRSVAANGLAAWGGAAAFDRSDISPGRAGIPAATDSSGSPSAPDIEPREGTGAFTTASLSTGDRMTPEEQVELLHGLVAIPSLSGGEGKAVAYLVERMASLGLDARVDEVGNAVGTVGSGERHVVLLGHIDTVPGDVPVGIADGVLTGRGSVDAKGPLATFVCAAAQAADRLSCRVTVVGAVGEETMGSPGATAVSAWPVPDLCVIGEPSGWEGLCLGYRGALTATYRLAQPSRHTAGPGEAAAEQVIAFWNGLVAAVAERNGEATGFGAIAPSVRDMGTRHDGMLDEAWVSIGIRLPPGLDVGWLAATLERLAASGELTVHGAQEGWRSDKRTPLVPPFLRAIRAAGGTPRFTVKLGTSDMSVVGPRWRCPILAYGPGDAALDHTPEERIVLDEYLKAVTVLTSVLEAL